MKRLLLTALISLTAFTAQAHAQDSSCKGSKFKRLTDIVKFGDSLKSAKSALGKHGHVIERDGVLMTTFRKPISNIGKMVVLTTGGRVTRILYTYDVKFVRQFGGGADFLKVIVKKLAETYGVHDRVDQNDTDAAVIWVQPSIATLHLKASDDTPDIDIRIDCDALEEEQRKKAASGANFGF